MRERFIGLNHDSPRPIGMVNRSQFPQAMARSESREERVECRAVERSFRREIEFARGRNDSPGRDIRVAFPELIDRAAKQICIDQLVNARVRMAEIRMVTQAIRHRR
jgi:hypothetical protein